MTAQEVAAHEAKLRGPTPEIGREIKTNVADELAEQEIQNQILGYLRIRDIFPVAQPMNKRSQLHPGTPDILFAHCGIPIALEVKTARGKLSMDQERARDQMQFNGWKWLLVRSVTDVQALLRAIEDKEITRAI